jgi:hypothetical protein
MQNQSTIEETLFYSVGNYSCNLSFIRYSAPEQPHPLYGVELSINDRPLQELYSIADLLKTGDTIFVVRALIRAIQQALDEWCCRHHESFLTFYHSDDGVSLLAIYRKLGFACSGRLDTFLAYVNDAGERTSFKGMLNLLGEDDFFINDLWRFTQICDYYIGHYQTPVDVFKEMLAGAPGIEVVSSQSNHQ